MPDVELGYWVGSGGPAERDPKAAASHAPCPSVVMVHDVWGLSDHTRDLAERLASEGYGVLAVDLYRRERSLDIGDPGAWIRGLSDPQVLADLQQAVDFCAQRASGAGRSVAITGFCMGGMYTLLAAMRCRGLAAAVSFYGMLSYETGLMASDAGLDPLKKPASPLAAASDLTCPTLAFFGERDPFIPLEQVHELEAKLAATSHPCTVKIYPDAGHAFMNDTRPDAYRPQVAADAWARMLRFLATFAGSAQSRPDQVRSGQKEERGRR